MLILFSPVCSRYVDFCFFFSMVEQKYGLLVTCKQEDVLTSTDGCNIMSPDYLSGNQRCLQATLSARYIANTVVV